MLLKLMRKDLILHWRGIIAIPLTMAGLLVYSVLRDRDSFDPRFLFVMITIVTGQVPVVVVAREERKKTRPLTCSLPVSRTATVVARYVGAWVVFAATAALSSLLLLAAGGPALLREVFRLRTVIGMLAGFTLTVALFMPLVERFGYLGMIVALVALQLLGLAAMLGSMLFPGLQTFGSVLSAARGFFSAARERVGELGYYAACTVALASAYAASLGASIAVFRQKEI